MNREKKLRSFEGDLLLWAANHPGDGTELRYIRPNRLNPDFPVEASAKWLERLPEGPDKAKKALQKTQEDYLALQRKGCSSDNLDWIGLVAELRGMRWNRPSIGIWVDFHPPTDKVLGDKILLVSLSERWWSVEDHFGKRQRKVFTYKTVAEYSGPIPKV
jgi:hypothetical protein